MKYLSIFLFAFSIWGQYPNPCSDTETDCYDAATNDTSCVPCYQQYCVVWDLDYGSACDAFCYQDSPDVCSAARTGVQSGFDGCTVNLTACTPSDPYYCHYYTFQYDTCTDLICTPKDYGGYFCNNRSAQLKEKNRAKTILARIRARHNQYPG